MSLQAFDVALELIRSLEPALVILGRRDPDLASRSAAPLHRLR
jgi:hypothetical protein